MRIPSKGTRGRAIVELLLAYGDRRIDKVVMNFEGTYARSDVTKAINDLIDKGLVINVTTQDLEDERALWATDTIRLSQEAQAILADHVEMESEQGDIVPAPIRNVFGPAISAKNIPSSLGMREGSNDHLSWSSKHV